MKGLDLFSGAGGCSVGYARAGFEMTGVDNRPQPRYPFRFVQADALEYVAEHGHEYDFIAASPPCQKWIGWQNIGKARGGTNDWPDLVTPTRALLIESGLPYVIENGPNTPLVEPVTLCGSMFGLGVRRHRKFESNMLLMRTTCRHRDSVGVYGKLDGRRLFTRADGSELRNPSSLQEAQEAMGISWMSWDELREAIPPAYCHFIGQQLMRVVRPDDVHRSDGSSPEHTPGTYVFPDHRKGSSPNTGGLAGSESYGCSPLATCEATDGCFPVSNRGPDELD